MAPLHDSDIATERWKKSVWDNFELWEKVELRLLKRKYLWIALTTLIFLLLSSVPTVLERTPKWLALSAVQNLAVELGRLRLKASRENCAYRLRFLEKSLEYEVFRLPNCSAVEGEKVNSGSLMSNLMQADGIFSASLADTGFEVLSPEKAASYGISGVVLEYCYDYLSGSDYILKGLTGSAFVVYPRQDLVDPDRASGPLDRSAVLLIQGPHGEFSFE